MPKTKNKKNDYLSHTQVEIGKCPHRYNEFYNKKLYRDIDTLPLKIGKFKHEFAKQYVDYCVSFEQQDGDEIIKGIDSDVDIMEKIFKELWPKYFIDEEHYKMIYEECLEFAMKPINYNSVLNTEKHFRVEFDTEKFFEGYIDINRIYKFRGIAKKDNDDILHTFDYKNQMNILKAEETLTTQLRLYTFANYHTLPKFKYYRRGIYYLKYNFIRCYESEDDPTPLSDIEIEVEETKAMLLREWDKLKIAKEFPAVTGDHCYQYQGCPILLAGKCPKIKKKDFESIDDMVRKVFQMDVQLKDLKKKAKAYIKENGNVTVDDKEVGWLPDDKESYPFEPAYDIAKDSKFDFSNENFPKTLMNKIIKHTETKLDATKLMKQIDKIRMDTKDTKFKIV